MKLLNYNKNRLITIFARQLGKISLQNLYFKQLIEKHMEENLIPTSKGSYIPPQNILPPPPPPNYAAHTICSICGFEGLTGIYNPNYVCDKCKKDSKNKCNYCDKTAMAGQGDSIRVCMDHFDKLFNPNSEIIKEYTNKTNDEAGTRIYKEKVFITKDSGVREKYDTGAQRDTQDGKPRFDLIPVTALKRLADLYYRGSVKYNEHNWRSGILMSRCFSSAFRHLMQFAAGDKDEDHAAAVCFNLFCIMHFEEMKRTDLDDMEKYRK